MVRDVTVLGPRITAGALQCVDALLLGHILNEFICSHTQNNFWSYPVLSCGDDYVAVRRNHGFTAKRCASALRTGNGQPNSLYVNRCLCFPIVCCEIYCPDTFYGDFAMIWASFVRFLAWNWFHTLIWPRDPIALPLSLTFLIDLTDLFVCVRSFHFVSHGSVPPW